jgi:hypothetical protein
MTLSPPVVNDWQARYAPDAADFNLYINNALAFLQAPPVLRAVQLTAQSMTGNQWDTIYCDNVREDTYSGWNAPYGFYAAQVAGWYSATTVAMVAEPAVQCAAGFYVSLDVNGSFGTGYFEGGSELASVNPNTWEANLDIYLNVGDWIYPAFHNLDSSAHNTSTSGTSDGNCSYFSLVWFSE